MAACVKDDDVQLTQTTVVPITPRPKSPSRRPTRPSVTSRVPTVSSTHKPIVIEINNCMLFFDFYLINLITPSICSETMTITEKKKNFLSSKFTVKPTRHDADDDDDDNDSSGVVVLPGTVREDVPPRRGTIRPQTSIPKNSGGHYANGHANPTNIQPSNGPTRVRPLETTASVPTTTTTKNPLNVIAAAHPQDNEIAGSVNIR